jgi:hypothetical protein
MRRGGGIHRRGTLSLLRTLLLGRTLAFRRTAFRRTLAFRGAAFRGTLAFRRAAFPFRLTLAVLELAAIASGTVRFLAPMLFESRDAAL